ncbi:MAG: biotin/lipoyl-containing protein [Desulfurococcaceae archaeon]
MVSETLSRLYRVLTLFGNEIELEVLDKNKDNILIKDLTTGNIYKIKVRNISDGRYIVEINNEEYPVIIYGDQGMYIGLLHSYVKKITPVSVSKEVKKKQAPIIQEPGVIVSPIAGRVVEIKVTKGMAVNTDDVIALLESMKMIIEVKSHLKGVIEEIYVKPGMSINKGDKIARIRQS